MTGERHVCVLLFVAISLVQLWSSRKPRMHATLLRQAGVICSLEVHQAGVKPQRRLPQPWVQPIHHPVLHSGFRPPVPATLCLRAPGSGPCTCTEQQIALSCSLLFPRSAASIGLAWWGQLSDSRWQAQGSAKGGSAGALQQTQRSPP